MLLTSADFSGEISFMKDTEDKFRTGVKNPHDAAFKIAFQKRELAKSFFRHYFPKEIVRRIDFRHLKLQNRSYVDEKMKDRHSDIVYQTKIRGKIAFLYILFEHQSRSNPRMPFKLLCYMVNLWREFFDQNPKKNKLPLILPVVLYHGKTKWNSPRSLTEMMESAEGLGQYIPHFTYDLYDLRDCEDERLLLGDAMAIGVVLYLMKHIFDQDFGGHLESAMEYLGKIDRQEVQLEFLEWMLGYAFHAREDNLDEHIDRGLDALGNENARRMAMTIAERLRQEGMQKGIREGIQKGIGIGQSNMILKQLKKRFGYLPPELERRLNESGADVLDRFGESIFDFNSLEDAEKWWEDHENGGNA